VVMTGDMGDQHPFRVGYQALDQVENIKSNEGAPSVSTKSLLPDLFQVTFIFQDPRVLDAMLPFLTHNYGNPHSRTHAYGWESEHAMEIARSQVADLIGCDPSEIIFTSGATESNNLAVKGVAHFYGSKKKHIITTQTEHKCILASCRQLEGEGYKVTYLPVNDKGLISLDLLEKTIQRDTSLVTIMAVNNEIGVTQPIKEIGELCKSRKYSFTQMQLRLLGKYQ
ncbi:hypothetical protein L9F63_028029, partial [Diploptera punctata]